MDKLLTIEQVAQTLGIGERSVTRLRREDPAFPVPVRLGRSVRFRPADLERYVSERVGA